MSRHTAVHERLGARPVARRPIDATSVLSVYVVIMMVIPSAARFAPAGSIGAPATMLAIAVFFWWLWEQVHRSTPGPQQPQWVRRVAIVLLVVMLAVYAHAALRASPADEVTPADSGLLQFLALVGLSLTATDGIPSLDRLTVLLDRIAIVAGLLGVLAFLQFLTDRVWIDSLPLPGLTIENTQGLAERGMFLRPIATAAHSLEFGAVAAMTIPIALTRARQATNRRAFRWALVAVLIVGAMASLSRSAILCTFVALVVLIWPWSWRDKLMALVMGGVGAFALLLVTPGLIGTLRGLFLGVGTDTSVQSRTDSYTYAVQMIFRYPWLGRGYGTFLPRYWILDNGYLQFVISTGVIGLCALLALFVAALSSARFAYQRLTTRNDKENARALLASCAAGISAVAFFDLFSFPQAAGMLFLVLGMCGAARRLAAGEVPAEQGRGVALPG